MLKKDNNNEFGACLTLCQHSAGQRKNAFIRRTSVNGQRISCLFSRECLDQGNAARKCAIPMALPVRDFRGPR